MIDINGEYTFNAQQEVVWNALQNPRLLGTIIPTCWGVESIGDNKFQGVLKFSAGQISGVFEGTIELLNIQEPERYHIIVSGKAPIGIVKITGGMYLETSEENKTTMYYSGDVSFGGRIASVGFRVLEMAVNAMLRQSFDVLNRYFIQRKRTSE